MAAALLTVIFVAGAGAIGGSPSNFESQDAQVPNSNPAVYDGNMTVDTSGNSDWNCFANGKSTGFANPAGGITVGSTCSSALVYPAALAKTDPAATTSDDSWVNGQKMDSACAQLATNKNPGKDDFTNVASYTETRASDKHQFLYGATIRVAPNGSASENVELNQVAGTAACPITRTAGDHLLAFDYNQGGRALNLHALTWIDNSNPGTSDKLDGNNGTCIVKNDTMPCWGANVITPANASFDGDVNQSTISAIANGLSNQDLVAGEFAEFGVDLTTALNQNPNTCNTTSQIDWESRSSGSSFSSNPEDIAIEKQTVSNCGSITIIKNTDPRNVNQNFGYTASGGSVPTSFKLNDRSALAISSISTGTTTSTVTTSTATPFSNGDKVGVTISGSDSTPKVDGSYTATFTSSTTFTIPLSAAVTAAGTTGSVTFNTAVFSNILTGAYTFNEPSVNGFSLKSLTCTNNGVTDNSVVSGSTVSINLASNDAWVCTYVNKQKSATLSTQQSTSAAVTPGTGVTDTATVTGNASDTPTGTVTFYLCGPLASATGCSSSDSSRVSAGTGTLAATQTTGQASATSSPAVNGSSPLTPGIYCFEATWPGDTNYVGSKDSTTATNECFTVAKINTTTVTTPSDSSGTSKSTITLNGTIYDKAVVTGTSVGGDPTGTVHFYVCSGSSACTTSGTDLGTSSLVSDGVAATYTSSAISAGYTPTATGTYCFLGVYGGSTVYNTSDDSTTSRECFTVTDTTTSSSAQTWYPNDSASVSADHGATISGTLTIQLYTGDNCGATSGSAVSGQSYSSGDQTGKTTITVNSGKQTTFGVDSANAGSFSWKVVFTSDDANVGGSNHCESSSLTITN